MRLIEVKPGKLKIGKVVQLNRYGYKWAVLSWEFTTTGGTIVQIGRPTGWAKAIRMRVPVQELFESE